MAARTFPFVGAFTLVAYEKGNIYNYILYIINEKYHTLGGLAGGSRVIMQ